ncbi:hypothetical protein BGW38_000162 [Lunasporangiospora selenospora]|uniref:Up-regulated during septation protein 1 domain-containing protein n=1 Tax=Lunasporangiospora selenospora TaxID=979761 RepID=A0A9P6FVH1_9FUNG|nr:hypothetical protein BGW38_000162 [Lunasporangiospora selenospora]
MAQSYTVQAVTLTRQRSSSERFTRPQSPHLSTGSALGRQRSISTLVEPDYDHDYEFEKSKKSDTPTFSTPARKISSNNLVKAFRSVALGRKPSESNLNSSIKTEEDASGTYDQNPKVYLYQQQQAQQQDQRLQQTHFTQGRPRIGRPQGKDTIPDEWALNNLLLSSGTPAHDYFDDSVRSFGGTVRRNASFPDLKATLSECQRGVLAVATATTDREHSPICLTRFDLFLDSGDDPVFNEDNGLPGHFLKNRECASSSNTPTRTKSIKRPPSYQGLLKGLVLTHPPLFTDESLRHYTEGGATVSRIMSPEDIYVSNKELPPTPPGPPPLHISNRSRRATAEGMDQKWIQDAYPVLSSFASGKTKNGGTLPQDALKEMDPKEVQKTIRESVVASRIYKVMTPEQIAGLKKEQEELQHFVEALNVSLQIESRMRDASHALIRLHESTSNIDAVKAATCQLQSTMRKMDKIVQKTQQAMWQLLAIQKLLLQHEGAVLNAGMRRLDSENRELARAVMQLDIARDQEKEEKIRWRKEHTRLKVQSILFTGFSLPEDFTVQKPSVSTIREQPQEEIQEKLDSMERYVKELNDEVLQKDEQITRLKKRLMAVETWTDDFQATIQIHSAARIEQTTHSSELVDRLKELQSSVEEEFKCKEQTMQELVSRLEEHGREEALRQQLSTLDFSHKRSVSISSQEDENLSTPPRPLSQEQLQERRRRRTWRVRPGMTLGSHESKELHIVLKESLLELDRRIQLDESMRTSSTRPSSSSTILTECSGDVSERSDYGSQSGSSRHRRTLSSSRQSRSSTGSNSSLHEHEELDESETWERDSH